MERLAICGPAALGRHFLQLSHFQQQRRHLGSGRCSHWLSPCPPPPLPNRVSFNVKLANFVHLAAFLYRHSHLLPLLFFFGRHLWCLVFGSLVLQVNMELLNSSWFWHNHMIYNVYHNRYLIYYCQAISELLWTANDEHFYMHKGLVHSLK